MKTKRALFVLAGMLLSMAACVPSGSDSTHMGTLIVASKSGDDVYFIDRQDGQILAVLPTGLQPHEVEVSHDGRWAVVCNYGDRQHPGHTLSVYDVLKAEKLRTIDLGEHTRPHGMKWISGTTRLLVTTEGSRHLLLVDIETGEIVMAMDTDQAVAHMVAASPGYHRAYVTSIRTGDLTVFDLNTGEQIARVHSGSGAEGIDVSPDGQEVWVTNRGENTLSVFDAETIELLEKIPTGEFPIRAKFSPDGRFFAVSNAQSGTVEIFDAPNRVRLASVQMVAPPPSDEDDLRYFSEFEGTSIPIGLVIPDNSYIYVANTRSDAVTIISLETLEIVGHFNAGKEPDGIHASALRPNVKKEN